MNIRYRKTVPSNKGKIHLRASLKATRRNLVDVEVELFNANGELGAEGVITYYTFSQEVAKDKMYFPDYEAFFEE
jgi:acyl-coenzyme A thioesterase PaaI-like protein